MIRTYNAAVPVVDLIDADSPESALRILCERLEAAGFQTYEGELPDGAHAFESEPLESEHDYGYYPEN